MTDRESVPDLDLKHVWHPFTQSGTASAPIEIIEGKGARLITADGKEYLDLVSSWWVTTHGHGHPVIARAIGDQAMKLEQAMFTDFTHELGARLALRLADCLPGDLSRVFFSDNGSTAVEAAMKIAWQYWRNRGDENRTRFISFSGGYHGDTLGAMSLGYSTGFYEPFADLVQDVDFLPYPETWNGDNAVTERERESLDALEALLQTRGKTIAAVMIEPLVQGAGGMRMCRPEFLQSLCERLREAGVIIIFDEVMTGFGRTGELFACLKAGVTPDIICLAKGLTGGFLPLAATVCREEIHQAFVGQDFATAFAHGHSFTANPLGCAAAHASLDLFDEEQTLSRIRDIEAIHRERLAEMSHLSNVHEARVCGDIAAFNISTHDLRSKGKKKEGYGAAIGLQLRKAFMDEGLLMRPLGDTVYLMPPYCIGADDLHRSYDVISRIVSGFAARTGAGTDR